jgi:hypothetical protein
MVIYNLKFDLNVTQHSFAMISSQTSNQLQVFSFNESFSTLEKANARQDELLAACMTLKIVPTYYIKEVEIK